jgi:adenylosuccinate synthase
VLGISKAYCTRVGGGPFMTEVHGEMADVLRGLGNEYGAVTGRPRRCGWADAVALRYAARINGLDTIALTKLDVLDTCETVRICVGYRYGGEILTDFPEEERIWHEAEPVYEELSGWQSSTHGMRSYAELPTKAREYVERLADLVGVGFSLVSTGPVRDETILLDDSPLSRWYPALRSALPEH